MKRRLKIEVACDQSNVTGESPIWSMRDRCLYWVDIRGRRIWRLTADGAHTSWGLERNVGAVAVHARGGLLVTMDDGIYRAILDDPPGSVNLSPIVRPPLEEGVRLKEGKVDPGGRYWCGSTGQDRTRYDGSLFRLDGDEQLTLIDDNFILVNGIAFSPDQRTLVMSDTPDDVIYAYDFDVAHGAATNRRHFFSTRNFPGAVDGATFDSEGGYWGAMVGDWSVARIDAEGRLDRLVRLPVRYPTMCAFGGPELDILYVTTATHHMRENERAAQPKSGMLFAVHGLGLTGVPEPEFQPR